MPQCTGRIPRTVPLPIQGKTIDEWIAALKDRDPAERKRAVEVIGERIAGPGHPRGREVRLRTALTSRSSRTRTPGSGKAAAFFADLFKVSGSPEMVERLLEEHRAPSIRRGGRSAWSTPRADRSRARS